MLHAYDPLQPGQRLHPRRLEPRRGRSPTPRKLTSHIKKNTKKKTIITQRFGDNIDLDIGTDGGRFPTYANRPETCPQATHEGPSNDAHALQPMPISTAQLPTYVAIPGLLQPPSTLKTMVDSHNRSSKHTSNLIPTNRLINSKPTSHRRSFHHNSQRSSSTSPLTTPRARPTTRSGNNHASSSPKPNPSSTTSTKPVQNRIELIPTTLLTLILTLTHSYGLTPAEILEEMRHDLRPEVMGSCAWMETDVEAVLAEAERRCWVAGPALAEKQSDSARTRKNVSEEQTKGTDMQAELDLWGYHMDEGVEREQTVHKDTSVGPENQTRGGSGIAFSACEESSINYNKPAARLAQHSSATPHTHNHPTSGPHTISASVQPSSTATAISLTLPTTLTTTPLNTHTDPSLHSEPAWYDLDSILDALPGSMRNEPIDARVTGSEEVVRGWWNERESRENRDWDRDRTPDIGPAGSKRRGRRGN